MIIVLRERKESFLRKLALGSRASFLLFEDPSTVQPEDKKFHPGSQWSRRSFENRMM